MRKQKFLALALALLCIFITAFASIHWWRTAHQQNSSVLSFLPRDPDAVIYIDVAALRQSPFLAQLAAGVPQPIPDSDYAQFMQDTGFNFERDLDHLAIAYVKSTLYPSTSLRGLILIGEGRFDRQKITAYAMRRGTKYVIEGHEVIQWPGGVDVAGPCITFLSDRLVAISEGQVTLPEEVPVLAATPRSSIGNDWRERFLRLGGSPAFAVIRQETGLDLADKAPGGFRSPQLATLLNQLQWITIAAKPDADQLRIVTEGECASEATTRQLADVLNGIVILAQAGLNDPKLRQQLNPIVREAYLDMLKSADISKLDRGDTKAVRLVFSVPPKFLEAARTSLPLTTAPTKPDTTRPAPSSQRKPGTYLVPYRLRPRTGSWHPCKSFRSNTYRRTPRFAGF